MFCLIFCSVSAAKILKIIRTNHRYECEMPIFQNQKQVDKSFSLNLEICTGIDYSFRICSNLRTKTWFWLDPIQHPNKRRIDAKTESFFFSYSTKFKLASFIIFITIFHAVNVSWLDSGWDISNGRWDKKKWIKARCKKIWKFMG